MLSRREFGGGLAVGAVARRRGSETPPPSSAPPAKEPNLARILRTKKLRVGGLSGEEPYFYRGAARWAGFLVTMAEDLAAALGVELAIVEANWAELATDLHAGKIDLAFGP